MSHLITDSLKLIALSLFLRRPFIRSRHHSLPHLFARTQATFILNFLHVPSSSLLFSSLNHRVTQSASNLPPHLTPAFFSFTTCSHASLAHSSPSSPPPSDFSPSFSICSTFTRFLHPSLSLCLLLPFVLLCLTHFCQLLTPLILLSGCDTSLSLPLMMRLFYTDFRFFLYLLHVWLQPSLPHSHLLFSLSTPHLSVHSPLSSNIFLNVSLPLSIHSERWLY